MHFLPVLLVSVLAGVCLVYISRMHGTTVVVVSLWDDFHWISGKAVGESEQKEGHERRMMANFG